VEVSAGIGFASVTQASTLRQSEVETKERSPRMTARKLIQLLEALPPNTRIPVEPSVISTLKGKVQNEVRYVSEAEQDRIDGELLRKRSKADRKLVDWEKVKQRYGVR
jgi:hypothetical protein